MIDYSSWETKFPWVLSVHDRAGKCLYAKPGEAKRGGARKGAGRKAVPGSNAERCRRYRNKVSTTRFSNEIGLDKSIT